VDIGKEVFGAIMRCGPNGRSTWESKLTMKSTPATVLACLIALSASHHAYGACANDDPAAVAKSFYSAHADFSSENPDKIKTIITPRLFDALKQEYKCAQGQICSIEADVWTDAQDGDIGKPIDFATASNTGTKATVSMTYTFILDKKHRRKQHATLFLQRKSRTDCWLISDLQGPRSGSLVQGIEKWFKEYGSAL
jgi:hypothetical protein